MLFQYTWENVPYNVILQGGQVLSWDVFRYVLPRSKNAAYKSWGPRKAKCIRRSGRQITYNLCAGLPSGLFRPIFSTKIFYACHLPHSCYMSSLFHPPWYNHPSHIWWRVQSMKMCAESYKYTEVMNILGYVSQRLDTGEMRNKCKILVKGRGRMGDLDVDGRVILKWLLKETGYEGMNWIQVIHNRVQWWGLVNLRFP